MNKIKGQGALTKLTTSKIASRNKSNFSKYINTGNQLKKLTENLQNGTDIDMQVVSFSSNRDFSEQVLSILSYVKYVGNPSSWIIYSDGTHTHDQISLVESAFSFLKVVKIDFNESYFLQNAKSSLLPYKDDFILFAKKVAYGKKLFFYLNFDITKPTLFLDSDIVFYQKACCLKDLLKEDFNGWFLPDAGWGTLDNHYMKDHPPQHYQVNSGFFLCNKEFDTITGGLDYFRSLQNKYEHFTEQNVLHIILKDNQYMPLDPRIFIINTGDQFDFSYLMPFEKMALRHYTGPVRHKMWQSGWQTQLNIK